MHMAHKTRPWTIEDLDRLPDDGNKYEVVRGELFVTPAPVPRHELLVEALSSILFPYVASHKLGTVARPRAVFRFEGSEVEPDLYVRPPGPWEAWEQMPKPTLIVEILSRTTRRRDFGPKLLLYRDAGVPDYWIVDGAARAITVVRPTVEDVLETRELRWHPPGAPVPLVIDVEAFFSAALGPG